MKRVAVILLSVLVCQSAFASALVTKKNQIGHRNFNRAKTILPAIHQGLNSTFYCGCRYSGKAVDWKSCGYAVRKDSSRAAKVEWEHVVPAWAIGHQRQCWQQGGRKNCSRNDAVFQKAEGDLHNLVPAIGEVNNDRANFRFSVWSNSPRMYGQCKMLIDFKGRRAQPPAEVRGRIARITFYMVDQYRLNLSRQERRLYCIWAKTYPVDNWERTRNQRIAAIQGNINRYIADPNVVEAICR